ncbi:hypothetical protein [Nonomuraea basaltis]|uniref:hypothetical protein n=1 Tax=Nonomuraea basaltis TaxID=2495887 RepID=UPI00110C5DDB|nr:hypothetical protein [Nonomuraea basaltis]TMR96084.1 hypothetical protein EJK15_25045 [Nonomuraea basaltis]
MGETQPPSDWPGLEPERDGVTYDAKKIANIAGELRDVMEPIGGGGYSQRQGSIQDLSMYGSLADVRQHLLSISNWDGNVLGNTLSTSHQEFLSVYEDVLENFGTAIALVDAGAGNYQITNVANEGGV